MTTVPDNQTTQRELHHHRDLADRQGFFVYIGAEYFKTDLFRVAQVDRRIEGDQARRVIQGNRVVDEPGIATTGVIGRYFELKDTGASTVYVISPVFSFMEPGPERSS